ncbi:MAG TPA: aminotransferase class III-fold pyridoxal phosphate-dependent enzyme [Gemmataceae bacterium]|jgi:4-aminobutyrate aminotransferase/(S)-3-amino-2-methylpropionate transaminase|nr:aminotransferase class III-fold pyridoxal phosphate-dependent enzyme [Gemmataceae bacterium]
MTVPLHHPHEQISNADRDLVARFEPKSLRTYTPSQAVLARSAGVLHWTPEGRKLFDFSSGVLVANLGHNPSRWMKRFVEYMGWSEQPWAAGGVGQDSTFFTGTALTAYNAVTAVETQASKRLAEALQSRPGGRRLSQVLWAASGSEAIQKALWTALARDKSRDMIVATRFGFHGKKGLAGAVTGCETDKERDPRVRFISFPMDECADVSLRERPFDPLPYLRELESLQCKFGARLSALITEPYLGGGGSYHPPKAYLQMLQRFCRENDLLFILDEVQSNFGRTGDLFAFETYGLEPDLVVLGKGLGNGVPVAAVAGPADVFASLDYGEGSDTWSANPLCCAAVLATLDGFADDNVLTRARRSSALIEEGLVRLRDLPIVANIRGERGGMVWGVEMRDHAGRGASDWANAAVLACYRGEGNVGIHLLGPLAKKVLRIAPPLVITEQESREAMGLMYRLLKNVEPVSNRLE